MSDLLRKGEDSTSQDTSNLSEKKEILKTAVRNLFSAKNEQSEDAKTTQRKITEKSSLFKTGADAFSLKKISDFISRPHEKNGTDEREASPAASTFSAVEKIFFGKNDEDKKNAKKTGQSGLFPKKNSAESVFEETPEVLDLPPFETSYEVLDRYWLTPPYAYANIYADDYSHIHYQMVEPKLSERELIILEETFEYLRSILVYDTVKKREEIRLDRDMLREVITSFDPEISPVRRDILIYYLNRNFLGYGRLDALMHDELIEDITCNGAGVPLFLYHRRYANVETDIIFENQELVKYVLKLAQKADKQLSLTTPLVDAALPNGSRAQITYSDIVSAKGSSFTIRKFKADPMTPVDLLSTSTYSPELMAHIWLAVENRKSMLIAGGTASGKTSSMNAASFFIPQVSKIVSIEDTREIQLPHVNWLPMKTREGTTNLQGTGNVTMFSLLKAALRQRPEYIIVGEVRGEEAQTLFQAMNTGHTTYSTLHAGNVKEAINRLINNPINVPPTMFGALDLMLIQSLLYADGKGFRRCLSLNEIVVNENRISWNPLFVWNNKTDTFDKVYDHSRVFENIAYQNGWSEEILKKQLDYKIEILKNCVKNNITDIHDFEKVIAEATLAAREIV